MSTAAAPDCTSDEDDDWGPRRDREPITRHLYRWSLRIVLGLVLGMAAIGFYAQMRADYVTCERTHGDDRDDWQASCMPAKSGRPIAKDLVDGCTSIAQRIDAYLPWVCAWSRWARRWTLVAMGLDMWEWAQRHGWAILPVLLVTVVAALIVIRLVRVLIWLADSPFRSHGHGHRPYPQLGPIPNLPWHAYGSPGDVGAGVYVGPPMSRRPLLLGRGSY